jgi:hypothetical protein
VKQTESDYRDIEDAELFRFWIEEASCRPSALANALAHCTTPDEYRQALREHYIESIPAG